MALRRVLFVGVVLLLLIGAAGMAQRFDATLTGVVMDESGAVLPGVEVTATNQNTNVRTVALSDDAGNYTIMGLAPGVYRVEAGLEGFKKYVNKDIELAVEQVGRIDIKLQIGQITEEVHVVGEAPILNTETSTKGQVIYNEEIVDLPLEGREFFELAYLTAGVMPKNEGGQGGGFNVSGARSDSTNFVVDGANNNIVRGGDATVRPSLDSVSEFKVQTSNYSAEYGRRSTGVINVVLRSGTNDYHGNLFHFHRNAVFDARNFFDVADMDNDGKLDKSALIRNNFGGNLGGPIIKDKLFFFGNYEGMRRREGQTRLSLVPTLGEREGVFAEKIRNPYDCKKYHKDGTCDWQGNPTKTFNTFADNTIPADMVHPFARRILDEFYPQPNAEITPFNYVANKIDADNFDDYTTKMDWHFGEADNLSARYLFNDRQQDNPFNGSNLPGFGQNGTQRFQMLGFTYTKTLNPSLISQSLASMSRKRVSLMAYNAGVDWNGEFGIWGPEDPFLWGFPQIQIKGYENAQDGGANPVDWAETDFHFSDTVTWINGQHNIRFGAEMIRTQFYQYRVNNARGVLNFKDYWTGVPVADFLLGLPNNTNRRVIPVRNYLRSRTWSGFFQDDWKISRSLTLNIGVRYDLFLPPVDLFDHWSNWDPGRVQTVISGLPREVPLPADAVATPYFFGGHEYPRALVSTDKNNFAPRIGFAWRPWSSRTVFRVGFGQFFGLSLLNPIRNSLGGNAPFSLQETFSKQNSIDDSPGIHVLNMNDPFPETRRGFAGLENPDSYEMNPPSANIHQYNVTIEHQLEQSMVFEIGYVGSKGTHLGRQYDINLARFSPTFVNADGNVIAKRPYGMTPKNDGTGTYDYAFGGIDYYAFEANSNYHAFQSTLRNRGRGTNWRLNYVYSKSIDDSSRLSGAGDSGVSGVQDPDHRFLERGLSDFDRRHALTGSLLYKIPFTGHFLTRDWQMNSIFRFYTGTPVSPEINSPDRNAGEASRPDRIGSGALLKPTPQLWYNVADFPEVPAGSYRMGNTGRNVVTGPNELNWSFSLMRYFQMPLEGHRLQFRWEVFNVPNHANFFQPEEIVNIPTSAAIERAQAARQMQVALKYMF